MSSNVADPQTRPDGASQGYSSRSAVRGRVAGLIVHRLSKETPSARALRAQLRGALGKEVGSIPAIWDLTLDDRSEHMGDAPTRGEKAIHGALTLWALHQGSNSPPMHDSSKHPRRFASAIRMVAEGQRGDNRAEVHLRSLVSQLEAAEIPCDYAQLAADLFTWQDPRYRMSVKRAWGRQFARTSQPIQSETASDK